MKTDHPHIPWIDAEFLNNQRRIPPEELLRYAGQFVAWSWDGARILAGDADRRALDQKLRAAGIDPSQVVHDYVEDPDASRLP